MGNNLPQEYKGNFFSNFFKKIKGLFFRKPIQDIKSEGVEADKISDDINLDISKKLNNISFNKRNEKLEEEIKNIVENKMELLEKMPYERIKQLEALYDEEIEKNKKEIEYLNYQLKKVNA